MILKGRSSRINVRAMDIPDPSVLSLRELQFVVLLSHGYTPLEIGEAMLISPSTVNCHRTNSYRKLGTRRRTIITRWVMYHGLDRRSPIDLPRRFANKLRWNDRSEGFSAILRTDTAP